MCCPMGMIRMIIILVHRPLLSRLLLLPIHGYGISTVPNRVRHDNTQYTINIKSPFSPSLCVPVLSDWVTVCLLYLLFYYYSPYFSFSFSFQYTYLRQWHDDDGGVRRRTFRWFVVATAVVAVAVYCRLFEEWLFFHNKGPKIRHSSSIIRYHDIKPRKVKESRRKDQ